MKHHEIAILIALAVFVWFEFRSSTAVSVVSVPSNPANSNAEGIPTAPLNASTLTPAQLGAGFFDDQSHLGSQQPNVVPGSPTVGDG